MSLYSKKVTVKDIENILREEDMKAIKYRRKGGNNFQIHTFSSIDSYKRLETGIDEFDRAMIKAMNEEKSEREKNISLFDRDFEQFIIRNKHMTLYDIEEYRRCIYGHNGMSGNEYFYYNFCKINGELPAPGTWSREAFAKYQDEAKKIRDKSIKFGKRRNIYLEKPLTPQQSFYGQLKNRKQKRK